MNENKLTEKFWRDCDNNNFSKEATVLFYYLLYRYTGKRLSASIRLHCSALSPAIR